MGQNNNVHLCTFRKKDIHTIKCKDKLKRYAHLCTHKHSKRIDNIAHVNQDRWCQYKIVSRSLVTDVSVTPGFKFWFCLFVEGII